MSWEERAEGVIASISSKVELVAKISERVIFEEGKMAIVLKENTNGEKEEEAKFEWTFFANCLKERMRGQKNYYISY